MLLTWTILSPMPLARGQGRDSDYGSFLRTPRRNGSGSFRVFVVCIHGERRNVGRRNAPAYGCDDERGYGEPEAGGESDSARLPHWDTLPDRVGRPRTPGICQTSVQRRGDFPDGWIGGGPRHRDGDPGVPCV